MFHRYTATAALGAVVAFVAALVQARWELAGLMVGAFVVLVLVTIHAQRVSREQREETERR